MPPAHTPTNAIPPVSLLHDNSALRSDLIELTSLPTASGREDRVVEWVEAWARARPEFALERDATGNLVLSIKAARTSSPPLFFTAHLDHPAFVVEEIENGRARTSFRGGVMAPYFADAEVTAHTSAGPLPGVVTSAGEPDPLRACELRFDEPGALRAGDVATWALPRATIEDGRLKAPACDDLAPLFAALTAIERLAGAKTDRDVRVLLTLAEEVGFVGAIAACKERTMPPGSRVVALEASRSFADSPLGAGPIVRVGDRVSTFSPALTAQVAQCAAALAGTQQKRDGAPPAALVEPSTTGFRWQRKLMPGGACEASAYCAFGYEATCVCLPLDNYHNMGRLDEVQPRAQAGDWTGPAPVVREEIAIDDFFWLVELLVACGRSLEETEPLAARLEKLYEERRFVLDGR